MSEIKIKEGDVLNFEDCEKFIVKTDYFYRMYVEYVGEVKN